MTTRPCPLDGAAISLPGASLCTGCISRLRLRLTDVPGLLRELDTTASRLASTWREPGPRGGSEPPTLWHEAAVQAGIALRTILHGWVRVWDEEHPIPDDAAGPLCHDATCWTCDHPSCQRIMRRLERPARFQQMSTPAGQALLLAGQTKAIAVAPWGPDLATELAGAIIAARRAIDTPAIRLLVCTCSCGTEVTAPQGAAVATCRDCGERWDVAASRALLLEAAQDVAAPAALIERTLGPSVVTAAQIRGWRHRGALQVAETNAAGQPCYSIASVTRLARQGAPPRPAAPEVTCANAADAMLPPSCTGSS